MALSEAFVGQHIARWQGELTGPVYAHRRHWPSHLFHHAPVENAAAILRDGCLRSRNDAANQRARDVAAPGVIDVRDHAHNSVRLYFRPKTPTQGRRVVDFYNEAHAPVPPDPRQNWIWRHPLTPDMYFVEVRLEGQLAYQSHMVLGDTLF